MTQHNGLQKLTANSLDLKILLKQLLSQLTPLMTPLPSAKLTNRLALIVFVTSNRTSPL